MSADPDWTQPPPNNAGLRHLSHSISNSPVTPKKKTIEFENLEVSYDYDQGLVIVESCGQRFSFDSKELTEFQHALVSFGLPLIPPVNEVTYR